MLFGALLKPCELNLKCLTGNDGKGCKHYIYDLHNPSHREKIVAERDKSSIELSRLFEVYEKGIEAAKMHIDHHKIIVKNTTAILDKAEVLLNVDQIENLQEYITKKGKSLKILKTFPYFFTVRNCWAGGSKKRKSKLEKEKKIPLSTWLFLSPVVHALFVLIPIIFILLLK